MRRATQAARRLRENARRAPPSPEWEWPIPHPRSVMLPHDPPRSNVNDGFVPSIIQPWGMA